MARSGGLSGGSQSIPDDRHGAHHARAAVHHRPDRRPRRHRPRASPRCGRVAMPPSVSPVGLLGSDPWPALIDTRCSLTWAQVPRGVEPSQEAQLGPMADASAAARRPPIRSPQTAAPSPKPAAPKPRRPKTEARRPKTEDRRPQLRARSPLLRRPKTEDRRPKTEDRRPKLRSPLPRSP